MRVSRRGAENWIRRWSRAGADEGIYGAGELDALYGDDLRGVEWESGMSPGGGLPWLLRMAVFR